jgi:hypothetical protein
MARQRSDPRKTALAELRDLVDQIDSVVDDVQPATISPDAFAESMRLIDQTIPPKLGAKSNGVLDWVSATLEGDEDKARELGWSEEMKRYRI